MTEEIKAIIEKNLPAQVGETLKGVIAQGQKDALKVSEQSKYISDLQKDITAKNTELSSYQTKEAILAETEKKIDALKEMERNRKVFEAELKLSEAEKRIGEMTNFVGMVFKSPIYRKNVSEYQNYESIYDSIKNEHRDRQSSKTVIEDKSQE